MKQNHSEEFLADFLVILSVGAIVMAGIGSVGSDVWLASTQWLLVSTILMLYAIYIHLKK